MASENLKSGHIILTWQSMAKLLLIASALLILVTRPALLQSVRKEEISSIWLFLGPSLFSIFFVIYSVTTFFIKKTHRLILFDFFPVLFGIFFIGILLPSSLREYKTRLIGNPVDISLINAYAQSNDARVRALALLAIPRQELESYEMQKLITRALIDRDPLVRKTAIMIIEELHAQKAQGSEELLVRGRP